MIIQNLSCHEYNEVLHKDAAIMIIKVSRTTYVENFDGCAALLNCYVTQGVLEAEQSNLARTAESEKT